MPKMLTRCDFRHNATIRLMRCDLRRDLTGEQFAITKDRNRGFVAGCLNCQDGHDIIVGQALRLPNPASLPNRQAMRLPYKAENPALLLNRVALWSGLLRINHYTFERINPSHHLQIF